ncbi:hypothetical protein [Sediminibacterium sp.]|uniref:hypothetical protein n=1 Tax=Sediminibacterium sp. TaxID=1917865 RepID=UPI003F69D6B3
MAIIATYDVPSKHVELKKALFAKGYTETIPHIDANRLPKKIYLPNTTVYHASKTSQQAKADIQASCSALNIKMERFVSTVWQSWDAIWGEPFGS